MSTGSTPSTDRAQQSQPASAGIDIGAEAIYIAIKGQAVKSFATFTEDLLDATRYLRQHDVGTVVIEATGVLWFPLMEIFTASGIDTYLVNGAHARAIAGRKSDVQDCQWLDQLY